MPDGNNKGSSVSASVDVTSRARRGDPRAVRRLVQIVSRLSEVALERLPKSRTLRRAAVRARYLDAAIHFSLDEVDGAIWRWTPIIHGNFDAYVVDTLEVYFLSLRGPKGQYPPDPFSDGEGWTPELVARALDREGREGLVLSARLAGLVVDVSYAVAHAVHRRARAAARQTVNDLQQDIIVYIYDTPGPKISRDLRNARARGEDVPDPDTLRGYSLRKWAPSRGRKLGTYLSLIAENYAWQAVARDLRRPDGVCFSDDRVENSFGPNFRRQVQIAVALDTIVRSLRPRDARIVELIGDGKDTDEIAKIMGVSCNAVNQRCLRLRRWLKKTFPDFSFDD